MLLSTYSHALEKLNVQLWAERDLISNNDKYILNLHTSDWQSGGILYWIGTTNSLHFRGNQKGLDFALNSFEPGGGEKTSEYKIIGKLTPQLNRFEAELHHLPSQNVEKLTFGSLFGQPNSPQHLIEFWDELQSYNRVKIDEIRILKRESRKLLQTIEVSHKNDIYQEELAARYVDLNFDGLILQCKLVGMLRLEAIVIGSITPLLKNTNSQRNSANSLAIHHAIFPSVNYDF
ncbi:hypothetical protein [Mannheimia pernigra]|uniref:hypothetical protein n=1 Tax=Mannheimia pernigra TaxID=111844 RepID=UPI001319A580|nr:hypothetical protein [Mannheimia pernigra]QHB16762.1 hypothetical protein GM695_01120 [Mannheimia pernigra]